MEVLWSFVRSMRKPAMIIGLLITGFSGGVMSMRWLESSAFTAEPDTIYVPDAAAKKSEVNAIPTFERGRTLSYDDLGRCTTLLKSSGFPKPYSETGGKQLPGHPYEITMLESKKTHYSDDQLRQCLGALDKIAPYDSASTVAEVEHLCPMNMMLCLNPSCNPPRSSRYTMTFYRRL